MNEVSLMVVSCLIAYIFRFTLNCDIIQVDNLGQFIEGARVR